MANEFIDWAKKHNKIKEVSEAFKEYPPEEEWHKGNIDYYIREDSLNYGNTSVGDIVFVENFQYENNTNGKNNLFLIIEENEMIPLEYFGLLISSRLNKLKYKENVLLKKDETNNLHKDSIVKLDYIYSLTSDMICYKIGNVPAYKVEYFKKCIKELEEENARIKKYVIKEKSILDEEFELLEQISLIRKDKKLSQRQLASIIGMKQPMLAKIENNKNSPQLNTLLKILDSLGYTLSIKKK